MNSIIIAQTILIFCATILMIILAVAGVFLIKLLIDLSRLANNLEETTTLIKHELEPTLGELRQTLQNLNSIAGGADRQFENVKSAIGKVANISGAIFGQFRSLSGGFLRGLSAGLQLFSGRK